MYFWRIDPIVVSRYEFIWKPLLYFKRIVLCVQATFSQSVGCSIRPLQLLGVQMTCINCRLFCIIIIFIVIAIIIITITIIVIVIVIVTVTVTVTDIVIVIVVIVIIIIIIIRVWFILDWISPQYRDGSSRTALLSLPLQALLSEGWISVILSVGQFMSITYVQVFLRRPRPGPPGVLGFSTLIGHPSLRSVWLCMGVEHICQMIKLHPLQEIWRADLVLRSDTAHLADHSSVIGLKAMQVRKSWSPGFSCM